MAFTPLPPRSKQIPPVFPPFLNVFSQASAIVAKLQAGQTTAAQLESENRQIQTEIYEVIHEIANIPIANGRSPGVEWHWILSSCVETHILQSNYDELLNRHLNCPCEITADIYADLVQKHRGLRGLYEQAFKSRVALQVGLQRFAMQPNNPPRVRVSGYFMAIADLITITARWCPYFHLSRGAYTWVQTRLGLTPLQDDKSVVGLQNVCAVYDFCQSFGANLLTRSRTCFTVDNGP